MNSDKPTIIAICGKSASGKDSLATCLTTLLEYKEEKPHLIISDTTRPKRFHEKDGVNYHFLTKENFLDRIDKKDYLEYDVFNGWYYGTPLDEIQFNLNVGIFTPNGVRKLCFYSDLFDVIVIYVKVNLFTRLKRAREREGYMSGEIIRRAFADFRDFRHFDNFLQHSTDVDTLIVTRNGNERTVENPGLMATDVVNFLQRLGKIK